MNIFGIGTEVLVTGDGGNYTTYSSFFKENGLEEFEGKFVYGRKIPINEAYTILGKGAHRNGYEILVLGNSVGDIYLMDNNEEVEEIKKEQNNGK